MHSIVLGTAQIGMNYGVNNRDGMPSLGEAYKILDTAYENNILTLDTAAAYGNSEETIGNYMRDKKRNFTIMTKLPKLNPDNGIREHINKCVNGSLQRLNIPVIDYYSVHNFEDIRKHPEIIDIIVDLKKCGKIRNIGISIYETDELQYINDNYAGKVDLVQIPFNLFDQRWLKSGSLDKAKNNAIKMSVRSIFLQGLFFLNEGKAKRIHPDAYQYINLLNNYCKDNGISVQQLAVEFIKSQRFIDYVLIGCETAEQLSKNIQMFDRCEYNFGKDDLRFIIGNFSEIDNRIIDPRLWKF